MQKQHIAIVGAGTAGLAGALALAKLGHQVSLFERFASPEPVGAGILLQPIGLQALAQLDSHLLQVLKARGSAISHLEGLTTGGKRIMDIRYQQLEAGLHALGMHRGNLFQGLYQAVQQAGVGLHCGHEVVASQQSGQQITLRFADGRELSGFDGVIVADGTHSKLRAGIMPRARCQPYPWGALWAITTRPESLPDHCLAQRYHRAGVMIGLLPSGLDPVTQQPCVSFFWSLPLAQIEAWQQQPLSDWKQQVIEHWPASEAILQPLQREDFALARYGDVTMRQWHSGRHLLIGDAAHGMSPQLGLGANLALVDAVVLADCFAASPSPQAAFSEYSRRRQNHLRFYQRASRWLTPFFQSHSKTAAWLRDLGMPLTPHIPWINRQALRCVGGYKTGMVFDRDLSLDQASDAERPG